MDTRQTTDSVIINLYRAQSPAAADMPSLDNQLSVMTQEMRTDENYFSKVESISKHVVFRNNTRRTTDSVHSNA